jgi:hypothetical protein
MKKIWLATFCVVLSSSQFTWSQTEEPNLTETIAPKYSNEFLAIGIGADALGL